MSSDEQVALPLAVPVVTEDGLTVCVIVWPEQRRAMIGANDAIADYLGSLDGDGLLVYVQATVRVGKLFEEKGFTVTY